MIARWYGNRAEMEDNMNIKILSFWGCETNPFANPETAGDGGGYFQPSGGCLLQLLNGEEIIAEVDDYSCGDFGTRKFWCITAPQHGMCWRVNIGTMDDACISSPEEVDAVLKSMHGVLGVSDEILNITIAAVNMAAYQMEDKTWH